MEQTLTQGYAFLLFFYAGLVIGLGYALLHLRFVTRRKLLLHLSDGLFVVLAFLVSMSALRFATGGALRLYALLTLLLGFLAARRFLVRPIRSTLKRILHTHERKNL